VRFLRQSLLLLAFAFVPSIGQALFYRDKVSWSARVAESEMVSLAQARSWGENAIWVDARSDADYERDHVPGAISLNEDRWNELLPQFLQKWSPEKKVIVYCSSQSCNLASDVARRLREQKLPSEIRVLKGGWEEWLATRP